MTTSATNTFESLFDLRQPSAVTLSADGSQIAFVTYRACIDPGGEPSSFIWKGPAGGPVEQWTDGACTDLLPQFSPDGSRIAFASDRGHIGRLSLFLSDEDRSPIAHGEIGGSIEGIQWSGDGSEIFVLAADLGSDSAGVNVSKVIDEVEAEDPDPLVKRPSQAWRRLLAVDAETGGTRQISPPGFNVWEFSWHQDGLVALLSEDPRESAWYDARLGLIDPDTGDIRWLYEPEWQVQSPALSPDGKKLAFVEGLCSDRLLVTAPVSILDLESGELTQLDSRHEAAKLWWVGDDRVVFVGRREQQSICGFMSVDGEVDEVWSGPEQLGGLHFSDLCSDRSGSLFAAAKDGIGIPPEVCVMETERSAREWRPITELNVALRAIPVPEVQEMSWESDPGVEVQGLLLKPADAGPEPLPMIVDVHGGPTLNWAHSFAPGYLGDALAFANAGYAVLLPNPRGSSGRGPEFARANLGDLGGGDFRDILAGVEACVKAGIADPERVGITGVSGGGLMSAWAVTQTDRFAAAIPRSCVSNWLSFHNTANVGKFDELFLESDPYDPAGNYLRQSPIAHVRKASTPTLVMHGEIDLITPVGQAQELYQGLAEAGCVTELVIYPREGHGHAWAERAHLVDCWQRMLGWFDRYLGVER